MRVEKSTATPRPIVVTGVAAAEALPLGLTSPGGVVVPALLLELELAPVLVPVPLLELELLQEPRTSGQAVKLAEQQGVGGE